MAPTEQSGMDPHHDYDRPSFTEVRSSTTAAHTCCPIWATVPVTTFPGRCFVYSRVVRFLLNVRAS